LDLRRLRPCRAFDDRCAARRRLHLQALLAGGSLDAGSIGILVVLIASALLNAAYFAPVVYHAFFGQPPAATAAANLKSQISNHNSAAHLKSEISN